VEQLALAWEPRRRTFTVAELNAQLRALLDGEFTDIWVSGEISGCRTPSSGHCYFSLKDKDAQLKCVCYRSSLRYLKVKPQDGMAVLVRGRLDLYEARGEVQMLVEALEPQGHGALQFAFEQLKTKLAAEGLFEQARKRALPKYPQRIGIITSPTGAVIRDMANVLSRRFPGLHVRLYPSMVQGEGSVEQVCRSLEYFSRTNWAQVVILARGGGSLEDLWTFNEEAVARAIASSTVPVVSAIGHETDFTIADFVADLRAATPSAAAELVICTREQVFEQLSVFEHKMIQSARYRVAMCARRLHQQGVERASAVLHRGIGRRMQRVDELDYNLRRAVNMRVAVSKRRLEEQSKRLRDLDLRLRLSAARRRLEKLEASLKTLVATRITKSRGSLEPLIAHITQLSPLRILDRGYAIVSNAEGRIVKSPEDAALDEALEIRVAKGNLQAKVTARR
jgi:exodeoxyribonuclease VII large subunit